MRKPVDELERLRRILVIQALVILIFIIAGASVISIGLSRMRHQVTQIRDAQATIQMPKDGRTPVKGVDYFDGQDSVSTHTVEKHTVVEKQEIIKQPTDEQVDAAIERYCSVRNDCVGEEGPRGPTGRSVITRVVGDIMECKFLGDEIWLPLSRCEE